MDATKSQAGAGGPRRSAPARGALPPPGSPPAPSLAGGCELPLVKPSPGIYRSLERNEVAFGEEGGGPSDSHSGRAAAPPSPRAPQPPGPRGGSGGRGRERRRRRGAAGGAGARRRGATHLGTSRATPAPSTPLPAAGGSVGPARSSFRSLPSPAPPGLRSARRGPRSCAPGAPPGHPGPRSQDKAMKPALLEVMRMNRICRMVLATCLGSFILVIFYFQIMRRNPFGVDICCRKGSRSPLQELYNPTQIFLECLLCARYPAKCEAYTNGQSRVPAVLVPTDQWLTLCLLNK
uniref:Carbohydrate sulfotransferase 11 n=1 Tax=Equus asinus TaxID=9793 RepID=A0A9L0J7S7_EQUAS